MLIFRTTDNRDIIFSFKAENLIEVKQFLNDVHLKYIFEANFDKAVNQSIKSKTNGKYS